MSNSCIMKVKDVQVHILPVLESNYIYVLEWEHEALVIDPAESAPVIAYLEHMRDKLRYILNTHPHYDHVAGNLALKSWSGASVFGPASERIPGLDHGLHEGDEIALGPLRFEVIETPGHTRDDICYYEAHLGLLFAGDTLFAGGCGRLFEGSADEMWHSLLKLRALPDDTKVFFGHEYTENNLMFAEHLLPDHGVIGQRLEAVSELRSHGRFTVPTTIGEEKESNIFLMCDDPEIIATLGMEGFRPEVAFGEIRDRKNRY